MAQYDGSIRINTKIDSKDASAQMMTLENRIVKTADKVAGLRSKMDALKGAKIPTQEYAEIQRQIESAEKKIADLQVRQEKFFETGGKANSSAYKKMEYDLEELRNSLPYLQGELQDLVDTGKAFTLGENTSEYANLGQQLQYAENDMVALNQRHDEMIAKQGKAADGYKKLGNTAKQSFEKINKSAKKSNGFLSTMASRFRGLALSLLIFNQISKAFNALTRSIKEGFGNLYNEIGSFKSTVDGLKVSSLVLKNSFAAAFRPLVETAIPYIQKAIEWLTLLMDRIGQFIALAMGQKTYTKAVKQTAAALEDAGKAAKGYLSPLDEINQFTPKEDSGGAGDSGTMFEEVPVDGKLPEIFKKITEYAKSIKDIFSQGFWDVLGNWENRWDSIKNSLKSIKDSLADIWTDPAVLNGADNWAKSVTYMLGSITGTVASIGLTLGTNLIGGISGYISQNKDLIKQYLISMFDIWGEVNSLFSELFQSVSYIFEAFASENGQQLTANIIGIFSGAFMGIMELASKAFRDIAQIIITPFSDNKEAFRTALEGFLGVLSEITGTVKQGIDDTFAKLNEVYDAHFKPFFDSVAQGLSDLVGRFLEFWNGNVQPILDAWAERFNILWKEHIQPLLNNFMELLGSVADLIKVFWETILKPLIDWVIDNILPVLLPIFDSIYNTVIDVVGGISDAISGIIDVLKGVIDFIVGVFTGDWEKAFGGIRSIVEGIMNTIKGVINSVLSAIGGIVRTILTTIGSYFQSIFNGIASFIKTIFSGIKSTFSTGLNRIKSAWNSAWTGMKNTVVNIFNGIWTAIKNVINSILNGVEKMANGVINGINGMISALNRIHFSIPDWVPGLGGKSFGFDIPELSRVSIPRLATGTVVPPNREFMAVLGDNKREPEVVSPLSTMKQAVLEAIKEAGIIGGGNGQPIILKVILDGKDILYAMIKEGKVVQMSTGKNIFALE